VQVCLIGKQNKLSTRRGACRRSPTGQCLRGPECLLLLLVSQFLGHELGLVQYKFGCFGRLYTDRAFARRDEVLVFERDLFSHGVDERDSTLGARNVDVLVHRGSRTPPRPFPWPHQHDSNRFWQPRFEFFKSK